MRKCEKCKKEFDETSFYVKLADGQTFRSFLCRDCAKNDGVEIIEEVKAE